MFKINDEIIVINDSCQYTSYIDWIKRYAIEYLDKFENNKSIKNGTKGKIVAINIHLIIGGRILYLIKSKNNVYLFGKDGIKLFKSSPIRIEDMIL
jgi:flavin-dependent dehydrogenase